MADILRTPNNFSSLSVKDLLQARDLYHFHLINKANVVGTAIGRYLIRTSDPYPTRVNPKSDTKASTRSAPRGERTFDNSEVRDYSWPCVLVLVSRWEDLADFSGAGGKLHPDEMVPRTLYLPDGRTVPVCVVRVEQSAPASGVLPDWHWPSSTFGGGVPIIVESQGRDLTATAGCLVSDGHNLYALTSGHVCGEPGDPVYTLARGRRVRIGQATAKKLTRQEFTSLYPEFAAQRTFVQMDACLIKIENALDWTSQIFGLPELGPLADLNEWNITTRLIGAPVVAMGAASGQLEGRIRALFYRYKSIGGYDYVSDFLIAPREPLEGLPPAANSQHGDSGTVWHLVTQEGTRAESPVGAAEFEGTLRPLAIEWGGQVFQMAGGRSTFALATSLTNVCRSLDVEVVLEHNVGAVPFWGQMGHYTIASFACGMVRSAKLKRFMQDNISSVSFTMAELTPKQIKEKLAEARDQGSIVPLADVPDIVWKQHITKVEGGRDTQWAGNGRTTGPEHPTHFADIDEPQASDGKTLRELCMQNPANVSVAFWRNFYTNLGHTKFSERGLLPFRIWQFYDAMAGFASAGQPAEFLCAAGILSHYVGDACQPLHGSMYADGYKDQPTTTTHHHRDTGEEYTQDSHVGAGVHSAYESKMIDRHTTDLLAAIQAAVAGLAALPAIHSGQEAAIASVALMDRSAAAIPPTDLVDAYVAAGGTPVVAVQDAMWDQFGDATAQVMADGARVLAAIWDAAWAAGGGDTIPQGSLGTIPPDTLQGLYIDREFVPSLDLDHIGPALH